MKKGVQLFLLLGSNLGDRLAQMTDALAALTIRLGAPERVSSFYYTAAWGVTDQPDFLNQVAIFRTDESPDSILSFTQRLEEQAGPPKTQLWGARYLDIDLLFYGDQSYASPSLTIPHPEIPNRQFTLVPLVEIAPDFMHPVLRQTMTQLLQETTDSLPVHKGLPHEA